MIPGEYKLRKEDIMCNEGKQEAAVFVTNRGDRPVQVGSHFHFFEVNEALDFEREKAFGMRLNIPAGTAVRFEPGDGKPVALVPFSGTRHVYGLNNGVNGALDKGEES
ncbi:urease subunit beta [Domibacillus antri]|uniref:Urease subunit beta n=1 Tax=Domibacillus antri TaxID=1714264 RepID=A0A1Q8Q6S0_9BACI|nr:urease subunit beta [Domibacillus antri]OLN23029.1 urease subunit beta [Domibacillus antri]